ncbi:MAG: MlaE family ABC transporter permease [Prochlorothrix sp.]|nr:MlaE family lipid ABC transporter permease subunit [Prochlorothrix sp.]
MAPSPFFQENRWSQRVSVTLLLGGQVILRLLKGKLRGQPLGEQLLVAGPHALGPVLLTNLLAGMLITLQTAPELMRYGAMEGLGGTVAVVLCRELAPVLTAGIMAGQVGAVYAAELGVMRVTEQIDALHLLRTRPVDYLVLPRVVACGVMLPILTVFAITIGLLGSAGIAQGIYGQPPQLFFDSIRLLLDRADLWIVVGKAGVFGILIALIGCSWGLTTQEGAKGVGRSTAAVVVNLWGAIVVIDLLLSLGLSLGRGIN